MYWSLWCILNHVSDTMQTSVSYVIKSEYRCCRALGFAKLVQLMTYKFGNEHDEFIVDFYGLSKPAAVQHRRRRGCRGGVKARERRERNLARAVVQSMKEVHGVGEM